MRIVADDLSRVELVLRIEGILDLAEHLDQLAVLFAEELGAGQAAALRARDRAAGLEDDRRRRRLASGSSLAAVAGVGQIEERAMRSRPSPA